jgi:hypothetical protein
MRKGGEEPFMLEEEKKLRKRSVKFSSTFHAMQQ